MNMKSIKLDSQQEKILNDFEKLTSDQKFHLIDLLYENIIDTLSDMKISERSSGLAYLNELSPKLINTVWKLSKFESSHTGVIYSKRQNKVEKESNALQLTLDHVIAHKGEIFIYEVISIGERVFIATGGVDRKIKIWNGNDFSLVKVLKGHKGMICDIAYVDKSNRSVLVTSSNEDHERIRDESAELTVKIWDINSNWTCVKTLSHFSYRKYIPTCDNNAVFAYRDLENYNNFGLQRLNMKTFSFEEVKFSIENPEDFGIEPDEAEEEIENLRQACNRFFGLKEANLILSHHATNVNVWDPSEGKFMGILNGEINTLSEVLYISDVEGKEMLLLGGYSQTVNIFDMTLELVKTISVEHEVDKFHYIPPLTTNLTKEDKYKHPPLLALVSHHGYIIIINLLTFLPERVIRMHSDSAIRSIKYSLYLPASSDNSLINEQTLVLSGVNVLNFYNLRTGDLTNTVKISPENYLSHTKAVKTRNYPARYLISSIYDEFKIHSASSGRNIIKNEQISSTVHVNFKNQELVIVGLEDGRIQAYNLFSPNWKFCFEFVGHKQKINQLLFEKGCLISGCKGGLIKFWDLQTQICLRTYKEFGGGIKKINASSLVSDGTNNIFAVLTEAGVFYTFDAITGEVVNVTSEGHKGVITAMMHIPGCSELVTAGRDKFIKSWLSTDQSLQLNSTRISGAKEVEKMLYVPFLDESTGVVQDTVVYFLNPDVNFKLCRYPSWELIREFKGGHTEQLTSVISYYKVETFGDQQRVKQFFASCSQCDKSIIIWDVSTGAVIRKIPDVGGVMYLTFIPSTTEYDYSLIIAAVKMPWNVFKYSFYNCDTGKLLSSFENENDGCTDMISIPPTQLTEDYFTPPIVATGNNDGIITLMNPFTGEVISQTQASSFISKMGFILPCVSEELLKFNLQDTSLMLAALTKSDLNLFNPLTGESVNSLSFSFMKTEIETMCIYSLYDYQVMAIGFSNGSLVIIEPFTAQIILKKDAGVWLENFSYLTVKGKPLGYFALDDGVASTTLYCENSLKQTKLGLIHTNAVETMNGVYVLGVPASYNEINDTLNVHNAETLEEVDSIWFENSKNIIKTFYVQIKGLNLLLVVGDNSNLILHDLDAKSHLFTFSKHCHPVIFCSTFSFGGGDFLVTGDSAGNVFIFNSKGVCNKTFEAETDESLLYMKVIDLNGSFHLVSVFEKQAKIDEIVFFKSYTTIKGGFKNFLIQELNY